MKRVVFKNETDWEGWRQATRALILAGVEPAAMSWPVGGEASPLPDASGTFHVPRALVSLASLAIQARDPERFGLLYSLVWRVNAGEKVLEDESDPDLSLVRRMGLAVRADAHRMRTNMRFIPMSEHGSNPAAWLVEPAHFVVRANAQLISRRFPQLTLSIVTPDEAAHWDGSSLLFSSGLRHAEDDEALQAWWETHSAALLEQATSGCFGSGGRSRRRGPPLTRSPARLVRWCCMASLIRHCPQRPERLRSAIAARYMNRRHKPSSAKGRRTRP